MPPRELRHPPLAVFRRGPAGRWRLALAAHAARGAQVPPEAPVSIPLDLAPRLLDLQARVQTLEHAVAMDTLAFQLITEHPDQAAKTAHAALNRIRRNHDR